MVHDGSNKMCVCVCVYMDMVDMSFFTNLIFGIP